MGQDAWDFVCRDFILMLPIDNLGNPYWQYMSEFMKVIEVKQINGFLNFLKRKN